MANDLLIKINADAKNATKAFDDIRDKTSDLEGNLKNVALISGAAFAAFTAEIYFSVEAFSEARKASVELNTALQNQGIYTEDLRKKYDAYANAVQEKTGIDNDAVTKAQATAQTYLKQTEITEDLTFAIADLGAQMGGDLNGAAEKIARTIGTGTNAFARQGLKISESATEAERYAKVLEFVQQKSGGLAEEFNKADGYAQALATSMGNFQESIGQRFAPLVETARKIAIAFFDTFSNNPVLADLAVAAIAAGAAVSGLILAVSVGVPAFLALKAAVAAFGIASNIALAGIPLLIGAIVAGITLLALNWDKAMQLVKTSAVTVISFLTELFTGFGQVLKGVFTLDTSEISKGLSTLKNSFKVAAEDASTTYRAISAENKAQLEIQNADKKAAADREAAQERQHQANLRAIRQAEIELLKLQNANASAEIIALKTKEIETLKALDSDKTAQEIAIFRERKAQIQALQDEQNAEDLEKKAAFNQARAEMEAEFEAAGIEVDSALRAEKIAALEATAQTEAGIDRQLQEEMLAKKIAARNQDLLERKKYGVAVAAINKALNSDEVQGVKSAAGELVQLQQSKNSELKAIGKVAAVGQITISTAESAMNIYKGFSTIPIIGPALGVAGAAAAVAFGGERIAQVTKAERGGLMTGGIPGVDSIPVMAQEGELIAPKKNFDEVVGAVQTARAGGALDSEILETLKAIDSKFSNPQITNIQGDVTTDDAYVDRMVRAISDAVQYRNAQIYGVTA